MNESRQDLANQRQTKKCRSGWRGDNPPSVRRRTALDADLAAVEQRKRLVDGIGGRW